MSTFIVDIAALHALRSRCATVRHAFDNGGRLSHIAIDTIGPTQITEVLHDFEHHWHDGHAKVRRHLDAMSHRLDSSIQQYEHTEHAVRQSIDRSQ